MIGVKLNGRLGNQMFQYAFGFATAKKLKTNFFVEESNLNKQELFDFFELSDYNKTVALKYRLQFFHFMKYHRRVIGINHKKPYSVNKKDLKNKNCIYEGFFQSSLYFEKYKNQIQKQFIIRQKHQVNIKEVLNIENNKRIIALHVRRTDYVNYGGESLGGENLMLPIEYYNLCLEKIQNLENYNIVFVTDDPSFVKANFWQYNPIVSSNKSSIIDFQILMTSDIVVVANSSFSWWAAYLNGSASKIFAPKYWSGFKIKEEYPADIIPKNWNTIEI